MGLSLRPIDEPAPISKGIEESIIADKYYEPPLINIIKFACNKCPEKKFEVSSGRQACLAHPCIEVCPKMQSAFKDGKAYIDQDKCIKCGLCKTNCPYDAILKEKDHVLRLVEWMLLKLMNMVMPTLIMINASLVECA